MKSKLIIGLVLLLAVACKQENYETGDGDYSLLRADFAVAHTDASKTIDYFLTDENDQLTLQQPNQKSWASVADTFYRVMVYYNKVEDAKADVVSMTRVNVARMMPKDSLKEAEKRDPVKLESIWLSKNKRYLNSGFYLKTGASTDDNQLHRLAIIQDTVIVNADGKKTMYLWLFHDRGNVPEYYSQRSYYSIPVDTLSVDSISLTIPTYNGMVTKTLCIK